ncbi:hypothetical protein Lesp01_25740 [Lentzea sp. NBRC 102530]|nr:hypothetical protein Lesp01_25740 [Lentzea sp. NBRC 102530]
MVGRGRHEDGVLADEDGGRGKARGITDELVQRGLFSSCLNTCSAFAGSRSARRRNTAGGTESSFR